MAILAPTYLGNNSSITSATTIALTLTVASPQGNTILVGIERDGIDRNLASLTDSAGNAGYVIDATLNGSARRIWIARFSNAAAVAQGGSITATFDGAVSTTRRAISAISVSGLALSPLDKVSAGAEANSTAWVTGSSGALSKRNELAVGWGVCVATGTFTPTAGWLGWSSGGASFLTGAGRGLHVYQITNSPAAVEASGTVGTGQWYGILATYKGALSGAAYGRLGGGYDYSAHGGSS